MTNVYVLFERKLPLVNPTLLIMKGKPFRSYRHIYIQHQQYTKRNKKYTINNVIIGLKYMYA